MSSKRGVRAKVQLPRVPIGKRPSSAQDEFWNQQGRSGALNAYRQLTSTIHKGGRKQAALPGGKLQPLFKNYTSPAKFNGSKFGNDKNVLPGISPPNGQSDNAFIVHHVMSGNTEDLPSLPCSTVRVYLASNHRDMVMERNAIMERAIPEIQEYCSQQGLMFQLVDLQWGSPDVDTLNSLGITDHMRLREIEECKRLSIGPTFVGLLGDSYGDYCLVREIPEAEFSLLHRIATDNAMPHAELLSQCFAMDLNASPPVYILKTKDLADNEPLLLEVILSAARHAVETGQMDSERFKYYASSNLAKDITQGIFNNLNPRSQCLAYKREWRHLKNQVSSPGAALFLDTKDDVQLDTEKWQLNQELHENVVKHLGVGNSRGYYLSWDESVEPKHNPHFGYYIDKLCSDFSADVKHLIQQGIQKGSLDSSSKKFEKGVFLEVLHHAHLLKEKTAGAHGQKPLIDRVLAFIKDPYESAKPFVIHGASGSGKTVAMGMLALKFKECFPNDCCVVFRSLGTSAGSRGIYNTVLSITVQICLAYQLKVPNTDTECDSLFRALTVLRSVMEQVSRDFAAIRPLFVLLDGLDKLYPHDESLRALWAMKNLPPNVHIIVSLVPRMGDINFSEALLTLVTDEEASMKIEPLENSDLDEIFKSHAALHKRGLTEAQKAAIISNFHVTSSPFLLNLFLEESLQWPSFQEEDLPAASDTISSVLTKKFQKMERSLGCDIVAFFVAYITSITFGLHEREILDLMTNNSDVMNEVNTMHNMEMEGVVLFPPSLFSLLKYELSPFISENLFHGVKVLSWQNRLLQNFAAEKFQVIFPGVPDEAITEDATSLTLMLHEHMANLYLEETKFDMLSETSSVGSPNNVSPDLSRMQMPRPLIPANLAKLQRLPLHLKVLLPLQGINKMLDILLFNFDWLQTKLQAVPLQELRSDIIGILNLQKQLEDQGIVSDETSSAVDDMDALLEFLQLAEQAIQKDSNNLVSEICSRLHSLSDSNPNMKALVDAALERARSLHQPLLMPLYQTFRVPGQALRHELHGPTHFIGSLLNGKIGVLFSQKSGTDIWQLETGELLQKFPVNKEQSVANVICGRTAEFVIIGHYSYVQHVMELSVWSSETGVRLVQSLFPHKFDAMALSSSDDLLMVATQMDSAEASTRCLIAVDVHSKEICYSLPVSEVHESFLTKIVFTEDDKYLITLGTPRNKELALWNLETKELEAKIVLTSFPDSLELHGSDLIVGSCSIDGIILVISMSRMETTHTICEPCLRHLSCAVALNNVINVATQADGIQRFSLEDGNKLDPILASYVPSTKPTSLVTFGDHFLFAGYQNGLIKLFHLETGECLSDLEGHTKSINTLHCVQNKWLISAGEDECARVWNLIRLKNEIEVKKHRNQNENPSNENVSCCVLSLDGSEVITASWDGDVKAWDVETGNLRMTFPRGEGCVGVCEIYWAGSLLIGHGLIQDNEDCRYLLVWNSENGEPMAFSEETLTVYTSCVFPKSEDRLLVISPSFDPQRKGLMVNIYDLFGMKLLRALHCNIYGEMNAMNLTLKGFTSYSQPDAAVISTITDKSRSRRSKKDATVEKLQRIYAVLDYFPQPGLSFFFTIIVEGAQLDQICMEHHEPVHLDTLSPKCTLVLNEGCAVCGTMDGSIVAWDVATQSIVAHVCDENLAKAMRDGSHVSRRRVSQKPAHEGPVTCLAMSHDTKVLVSGSMDDKVKVWMITNRQLLFVLNGHSDQISSVCISPDGKYVVSGSHDNMVVVWSSKEGCKLASFYAHHYVSNLLCPANLGKIIMELASSKPKLSILRMMNFEEDVHDKNT